MAGAEDVFIGAIDQGTTSTRFIIYDRDVKPVACHQMEFTQFYPETGWVEQDPMEILQSVRVCMEKAVEKATAAGRNVDAGLRAIGITNQRETTVVWSRSTGHPLYHAVVWMDSRTDDICKRLISQLPGGRTHFVPSCGLAISNCFSALKFIWLLENVDTVRDAVDSDDAMFGTIDTWLIWNLTGGCSGGVHVTDCSNAARTMLMNLQTLEWDAATLDALGIPISILPKIVSNSETVGVIANGWPLAKIPISGCLGDQHAAMLGQACRKWEGKCTYSTGAFILLNTGEHIVKSPHGLLTTVAYKLGPEAAADYALEGSIAVAGAAVQWLRDALGIIRTAAEVEAMAELVENSGGVHFVPAFNGLLAPWWRDDARGVCMGITRFTNRGHIARAVLESICFQVNDVLTSMRKDAQANGYTDERKLVLRVDGIATLNNLLMQIQADLSGMPVVRYADIETSALGAAFAAGLAIGVWTKEQIFASRHEKKVTIFSPKLSEENRKKRNESWCKAVSRTFDLADLYSE
ncbi:glycerol kinase-like [Curcuma longa]|uniref:glycerol kinase-like n=1 Tax=Curcuma longa TaxID=136217 RepID=UPI003D9DEAE0